VSNSWRHAERRAGRLVRWYPPQWRERYGEEFTDLLISEFEDRPTSWRRTLNVVSTGALTRLARSGLTGPGLEPPEQVRAGVISLGCSVAAFLTFGIAMWSQLTIGWQWSRPDAWATTAAMVMMSSAMVTFCVLGLLAALPIAACVLARIARGGAGALLRPVALFLGGATLLVIGSRHFGNGWPGTGGHPWSGQGLVPGGMAAFTWASTISISSYWVHPGALSSFPISELAWMAVSPLAIAGVVIGAAMTVRRLDLSPRFLGYQVILGWIATFAMLVFLVGSCYWVIDGGTGPRNLFHVGAIDFVEILVMAVALAIAWQAVQRSRSGAPTPLAG
jgi:hypothetical protein